MIKVLLISPYGKEKVGGIGTWTKIMLDYCQGRDDIQLFFQNTGTKLPKRSSQNSFFPHLIVGILDSLSILGKLLINMLRYKPDVVHYTSSAGFALYKDYVSIFIIKKLFRKRFIIHWRFGRIPSLCKKKNSEYRMLMNVVKAASASIVIDNTSFDALIKQGIKNVYCLPNPISPQLQNLANAMDVDIISQNREPGTVLFVGHILKEKGIFELIEACKRSESVKKLYVVGPFFSDEIKKQLLVQIRGGNKSKDWVVFVGEILREAVFEYYQKCMVFCLPSYTEGFPNSVIEAMANACPVLSTTVGAIPEILSDNCGVCVPPKNAEALADALSSILLNSESCIEMGKRGREKVLNNYCMDKVYGEYYKIWGGVGLD